MPIENKLTKKDFANFVFEVIKSFQFFCVWKYLNDKRFNKINMAKGELATSRYYNFWEVVYVAIQDRFSLSVRALNDDACFRSNQNKSNISIRFIAEKIGSGSCFAEQLNDILVRHKKFIDSVSEMSDKKIAHNDLNRSGSQFLIEAGREEFYNELEDIIKRIVESNDEFKDIRISLSEWDNRSQKGVDAVFSDLLSYFKLKNRTKYRKIY